jgi:hypothetical protein
VASRKGVPRPLSELCGRAGYVLVSIDYRQVPEAKE